MSKRFYQRNIPIVITAIIVALYTAQYFLVYRELKATTDQLSMWGTTISNFSILFAYTNMIISRIRHLGRRTENPRSFRSATIFLGSVTAFSILGLAFPGGTLSPTYNAIFTGIIAVTGTAAFNQWHHHIYNCYRLLRPTSLQATSFLVAFLFTWFRASPTLISIFPGLYPIATWVETVPAVATQRGVTIATAVGSLMLAIRVLYGKEPGIIEVEMQ